MFSRYFNPYWGLIYLELLYLAVFINNESSIGRLCNCGNLYRGHVWKKKRLSFSFTLAVLIVFGDICYFDYVVYAECNISIYIAKTGCIYICLSNIVILMVNENNKYYFTD